MRTICDLLRLLLLSMLSSMVDNLAVTYGLTLDLGTKGGFVGAGKVVEPWEEVKEMECGRPTELGESFELSCTGRSSILLAVGT